MARADTLGILCLLPLHEALVLSQRHMGAAIEPETNKQACQIKKQWQRLDLIIVIDDKRKSHKRALPQAHVISSCHRSARLCLEYVIDQLILPLIRTVAGCQSFAGETSGTIQSITETDLTLPSIRDGSDLAVVEYHGLRLVAEQWAF